jgi:hypothetical protein
MAEVFRELIQDLVKETTTSSGTANTSKVINLSGAADSRFQTFATAYGTSATNSVLGIPVTLTEGTTAQQTGLATFTHGTPSTIQFTSIDKGSPGITFTTAATVSIASTSRILNRVSLRQEAISITSANYTSAVPNTHYRITISGLTAARSFVLPVTGVKVGDIVSGKIITNAPSTAASVLSIKTDAAGSLVDSVDVGTTASTKWVYLISGESFAFRCVTAGGAGAMAWESMVDGRIACKVSIGSTAGSTWTTATLTTPDFNTVISDNANCANIASDRLNIRRGGSYILDIGALSASSPAQTTGAFGGSLYVVDSGTGDGARAVYAVSVDRIQMAKVVIWMFSAGDYWTAQYLHNSNSTTFHNVAARTFISMVEVL